jgi:two-component system, OmpR family, sensor kinase
LSVHEGRLLDRLQAHAASDDAVSELADLRRQVEELRQAISAQDDFIAIAAHELRNPMTPILGVAELALTTARKAEGTCPPRIMVLLERMQRLVQEYVGRTERLLDVSRIGSGNLRLEPSSLDLSALVLSVAQRYEVAAARGRSPLDLDVQAGVIAVVDWLAVEQVVENLLSNALKFGIGRPVTLRLRSNGQSARLDVQDHGIGVSADQQARIFGRFEQDVAQHQGVGFGVGLWVANRLLTAMDGRLAVSSRLGEGSTFTVALPLVPPEPDRMPHESA